MLCTLGKRDGLHAVVTAAKELKRSRNGWFADVRGFRNVAGDVLNFL
jgi:hypothetical protein